MLERELKVLSASTFLTIRRQFHRYGYGVRNLTDAPNTTCTLNCCAGSYTQEIFHGHPTSSEKEIWNLRDENQLREL